jgi:hypothetical protein
MRNVLRLSFEDANANVRARVESPQNHLSDGEHDRGTHRQSEPKRAIARALQLLVLRQAECLEVLLTMHPTLFTIDTYL